jgi:hypothetical protein
VPSAIAFDAFATAVNTIALFVSHNPVPDFADAVTIGDHVRRPTARRRDRLPARDLHS